MAGTGRGLLGMPQERLPALKAIKEKYRLLKENLLKENLLNLWNQTRPLQRNRNLMKLLCTQLSLQQISPPCYGLRGFNAL